MIIVTMNSGLKLRYNTATTCAIWERDYFHLTHKARNSATDSDAVLPRKDVARVEFSKPCRIYRERPISKLSIRP